MTPLRHAVAERLLVGLLVLAGATGGCEINSRVGATPGDGASPAEAGAGDTDATADASDANGAGPDGAGPDAGAPADGGASPDSGGGDAGASDAGGGPSDAGADLGVVLACPPDLAPQVSPVPLQRLTAFHYNNTVRDLLGETSHPADALPFEDYFANDEGYPASAAVVEGYKTLAHDLALKVTGTVAAVTAFTQCDPGVETEAVCQRKFIDSFVPIAFRRPLDASDVADFDEVFATGRQLGGDFASGVRAVIEVVLQSPEFLYRVEFGEPAGASLPGLARPTPYEMATRLSYLLWGSSPGPALRDAAAQNQLQTKEQVAAQAKLLLADPRAREQVQYFYLRLLNLNAPDRLGGLLTPENQPPLADDIPDLLLRETRAFIDEVTWQGPGDLQSALTAPFTFMNARLAQYYGVDGVTGDALQKVALDPTRRVGLLTQGLVLASTSHPTAHSPVHRGLLILNRILGYQQPPPSPGVVVLPPPSSGMETLTIRERLAMHLSDATCVACHRLIDPIGFAFEHFDRFGRWRDTENGKLVDATGEIVVTDAQGSFDGAIELTARLVQSQDVRNAYARNWMTFGYARALTATDDCSVRFVQNAFAKTNGNVRELLIALTQADAFLYEATTP